MSRLAFFIDLTFTYAVLGLALGYVVKRFWMPQACQVKTDKKPEVVIGSNLAKGLARAEAKKI